MKKERKQTHMNTELSLKGEKMKSDRFNEYCNENLKRFRTKCRPLMCDTICLREEMCREKETNHMCMQQQHHHHQRINKVWNPCHETQKENQINFSPSNL